MPKYFTLGQLEALANLKKLISETTLLAPGIFAHQKRSPDRQKIFVAELLLAAIAARLLIRYRFAGSVQRRGSVARSIIRVVKGFDPCAVAKCLLRVPKN